MTARDMHEYLGQEYGTFGIPLAFIKSISEVQFNWAWYHLCGLQTTPFPIKV